MRTLISASKDTMLKVWDLDQQKCLGTYSEHSLSKISDFCMIGELSVLVVAGADNQLKIVAVEITNEGVQLKFNSSLQKESNHRAVQITFDRKQQLLFCLSADNKMETFKVNVDRADSIRKKLAKKSKKSAKRLHSETEEAPTLDKAHLQE